MIKLQKLKKDFVPFEIKGINVIVRINAVEDRTFITYDECKFTIVNKDVLASSIIKANYSQDKMDAIRNNYELVRDGTAGDKTQEYTDEYLAMQEWRRYAKELASEIMEECERQRGQ